MSNVIIRFFTLEMIDFLILEIHFLSGSLVRLTTSYVCTCASLLGITGYDVSKYLTNIEF